MIKICIIFLALLLLSACNENKGWVFDEVMDIKSVEIESNVALEPKGIIIYDSLLIIRSPLKGRKLVTVLNLEDYSFLSTAIYLGRGPGELANPASFILDEEDEVLWISDWGKNECYKYPIDSLVLNEEFKPTESFKIDPDLLPMMNMFYHPSGYFGFSSHSLAENLISFIDKQGRKLDSLGVSNEIFPDLWKGKGISDNPLIVHYSSLHKKIVIAGRYENKIAVIDEMGNVIFKHEAPILDLRNDTKTIEGTGSFHTFYRIHSDEEFIYCLYKGGYFSGWDKKLKAPTFNYPNRILVFNWNGEKRYDLRLDHEIVFSTFDKKQSHLIGTTEDLDNSLLLYDLSVLKNKQQ